MVKTEVSNKEAVINRIEKSSANNIRFAVTDIDGVLRGKLLSKDKVLKALKSGKIGFCNVIFGWDINDACYTNTEASGWHTGYPDAQAFIDVDTLISIPWDDDKPFLIGDFRHDDVFKDLCPRTLLKNIEKQAFDLGLLPKYACEFEWFNFSETPQSLYEKDYRNPTPLTPGMFGYSLLRSSLNQEYINEIFDTLKELNIPLEGLHTETGHGVYEACITYDDLSTAADQAIIFKTVVKEIAYQYEILASFMAKWNAALPGCSAHIHQSLWDLKDSKNLFYDSDDENNMSETMKQFLAGQLHCLPHILPMFAPTVNSYKRFVDGSWAPTSISWGIENRTTALRVINPDSNATRIEHRVPGADINPYLAMSAALASGLYGIKHKLKLEDDTFVNGNAYDNQKLKSLPTNLFKATKAMKESPIANELFGVNFVDHFIRTREWEWKQYEPQIDNWELKRYFELI